jgi:hypothetical protein
VFLWPTRFAQATEVVALPFHELVDLAADARSSLQRIVFINSIGRCGSTLVCRALAEADDVVALSEPDVFIELQLMRDRGDPDIESLLDACTLLLNAPRAATAYVIKRREPEYRAGGAPDGVLS